MKIKNIITFFILGTFYLGVEVVVRMNSLVGINHWTNISLVGWTSFWMLLVGGLAGILIGRINEIKAFWKTPIIIQSLLGTLITLSIEFSSGVIFNIILKLNLWDYSYLKYHLLGQICLKNGILFFIFMPSVIWLDDLLRHGLYKKGNVYSFTENYKRLFTLK